MARAGVTLTGDVLLLARAGVALGTVGRQKLKEPLVTVPRTARVGAISGLAQVDQPENDIVVLVVLTEKIPDGHAASPAAGSSSCASGAGSRLRTSPSVSAPSRSATSAAARYQSRCLPAASISRPY